MAARCRRDEERDLPKDKTLKAWPTLSEAERATGINRGVLTRLIEEKRLIQDNGKKGRDRRVDPISLTLYCQVKGIVFEWTGN